MTLRPSRCTFKVIPLSSNACLEQPLQYLVQRIAETANEGVSFVSAATLSADPVSVLDELIDRARASVGNARSAPKFGILYDNYALALATLRDIREVAGWYAPHATAVVTGFSRATNMRLAAASQYSQPDWLRREGWPVVRDHGVPLVAAMRSGYADRMLRKVLSWRSSDLARPGHWIDYDDDVRHLLAALLGEGRPGTWIAERAIAACRSADPRAALLQELRSGVARFQVALSLCRARSVRYAAAFGCRPAEDGWEEPVSLAARRTLAQFVRTEAQERNWAFVVSIDAHDRDHAVARARTVAAELVAQLAAADRTRPFTLGERALVWQAGHPVRQVLAETPPAREVTPLLQGREPRLLATVAHLQHARDARAPVAGILHGWIALEALAYQLRRPPAVPTTRQKNATPYDWLGHVVPRFLALHGIRQALLDLWHVVVASERKRGSQRWSDVENWLGVTSARQLADVNRWFDVLAADPSQATRPAGPVSSHAEAVLLMSECLASGPAYPRRQLELWRIRITQRQRMAEFYDRLLWDVEAQVARLYALRNLTVHQGAAVVPSEEELARAAARLLDALLEVLPAWLATEPHDPPAVALDKLASRAGYVRNRWDPASHGRVRLNADALTRPGGDGINR